MPTRHPDFIGHQWRMEVGIKVRRIGVLQQQAVWTDGGVPLPKFVGDGGIEEMQKATDHFAKAWKRGIDRAHKAELPVCLAHVKGLDKSSIRRTLILVLLPPDTNRLVHRRDVITRQ